MEEQLKRRTKQIGLDVIKLIDHLPSTTSAIQVSRQIIRSATSVGANYRSACRAKSSPDFINKLRIVEEEADETLYWIELIEEAKWIDEKKSIELKKELNEIISIMVSSINTMRQKLNR